MTPNNEKPEWFQLTEGDKVQSRRTIKRGFRVFAVTLPLLVLGTGFVVAQTQGGPGTSADATTPLASAAQSTAPTTQNASTGQDNSTTSTGSSSAVIVNADQKTSSAGTSKIEAKSSHPTHVSTPTTASPILTPSIKPPTGGSDDGIEGSNVINSTISSSSISQLPSGSGEGHESGEHHHAKGVTPAIGTAPSISQLPSGGGEVNDD